MSDSFNSKRGLVVVPVEVFGPTGSIVLRCALDTGATRTMISVAVLEVVGYEPSRELSTSRAVDPKQLLCTFAPLRPCVENSGRASEDNAIGIPSRVGRLHLRLRPRPREEELKRKVAKWQRESGFAFSLIVVVHAARVLDLL